MSNRCIAAALAVVFGSLITGCSAADTRSDVSSGSAAASPGAVTIPTDSGGVTVPAATGGTTGNGSGTSGPNEKEKQRGNTPPGMSRDGAGPAGGAIVDPAGAATGKR
jgi:hypothetical protein